MPRPYRVGRSRSAGWLRFCALAALTIVARAAVAAPQGPSQDGGATVRLRYVGTARQLGPVAYRDPLGVPSPDGRWLATAVGLHLYVEPLAGGPVRELGPGTNRVGSLAWMPDSRRLVAREADMDRTAYDWFVYDVEDGTRTRLWPQRRKLGGDPDHEPISRAGLRELAFADDGRVAALLGAGNGLRLAQLAADGTTLEVRATGRLQHVTWRPEGGIACLVAAGTAWNVSLDCGRGPAVVNLGDVRGPIAFSPDGALVYVARPNAGGTLDLWSDDLRTGATRRLTSFARDTYAPYVLRDGRVLFKLQEYAVDIARVAASGGPSTPLTTFQSETPSWDWDGRRLGFTYGSWRRVVDDARYPDIAQQLGIVRLDRTGGLPADAPDEVVRHSASEDQGVHWSPDGRWIVLHSHADGTDDIWLQPADGSAPARLITSGGSETGWPRFSPDGRWIAYTTDVHTPSETRLGVLYLVGFDPVTGEVTVPQREVRLDGFDYRVSFAEFTSDGSRLVFESIEGPRARGIWVVPREGGRPQRIHAFSSEQWFTGISVSPDDAWVVYAAPADDGYLQLFRVPMAGGEPEQLTHDAVSKTQPSWSPTGDSIAFTAFRYLAHFWLLER